MTHELEHCVDVQAPPERVWGLVSDLTLMARWSPQVTSTRVKSDDGTLAVGTRFTNRNRQGEVEWTTHGEVVHLEPGRGFAFRIEENGVVWSFDLEPSATGTRLTQRRAAPDGISELSRGFVERYLGGQEAFGETMRDGTVETLEALRAEAERTS